MQSLGPLHQSTKDTKGTTIQIHIDETRGLLQAPVTLPSKTPTIAMIHNLLGENASLHFFCRNGFELHPREVANEGEHIFIANNKTTALQHIAQYHIASEFSWGNVSPEVDGSYWTVFAVFVFGFFGFRESDFTMLLYHLQSRIWQNGKER
jgi:hypothetical protein